MNKLSLENYNGPSWTEYYSSGFMNIKEEKLPTFTKKILARTAISDDTLSLFKKGVISNDEKNDDIIETFDEIKDPREEFLMRGHSNPIWVLLAFLFTIWAIFLIANLSV